jgi:hypothetical protein
MISQMLFAQTRQIKIMAVVLNEEDKINKIMNEAVLKTIDIAYIGNVSDLSS